MARPNINLQTEDCRMRVFLVTAYLVCCVATFATGEVSITKSPTGWELTNGHIRVELARSAGAVQLRSLRRDGGTEWAVAGTPLVAFPDKVSNAYRYSEDAILDLDKGGKQLTLRFLSDAGALISLELKLYPTGAVIQTAVLIENRSQHNLLLNPHIDPLFLTLKNPAAGPKPRSTIKGQLGFHAAAMVLQ